MVVFFNNLNNFNIWAAGQFAVVLLAFAVAGVVTGCGQSNLKVVSADATLPPEEDSAAFLDRMSSLDAVGENDAMRSILLLLDEKDTAKSFEKRVKLLADRNIVSANWDFAAHRLITRGKFAYMIYQSSKFPGGGYPVPHRTNPAVLPTGTAISPSNGVGGSLCTGNGDGTGRRAHPCR